MKDVFKLDKRSDFKVKELDSETEVGWKQKGRLVVMMIKWKSSKWDLFEK